MKNRKRHITYGRIVKQRFRRNKRAVWSMYLLYVLLAVYVLADFLANDKPLVARYNGRLVFPVMKNYLVDWGFSRWPEDLRGKNWKDLDYDFVVWPLVPYGPREQDRNNVDCSPGGTQQVLSWRWRHLLGTNEVGVDLLSAMIHATRVDLSIGVVAMAVATFLGLLMGALAGFFGDDRLRVSRIRLWLNLLFLFLAWFYAFKVRTFAIQEAAARSLGDMVLQLLLSLAIFLGIMLLANLLARPLERIPYLARKVRLPLDILVSRLIEVVVSIPVIFLIIMVLAIVAKGSVFWVMVVIGLTRWTGIARFVRAELLRIRKTEYIEAAQSLGFSNKRILLRHALPNALGPVLISIAFGIASAILIEAFLSFIGLGTSPDVPTWGRLLHEGSRNPSQWWLALFPGLAIFFTVTIFNLIGEGLTDALDPKQLND